MSSREWMTISSSTFFQESIIYSYSEWKDKYFQDYEKKECKVNKQICSPEWNTMMHTSKPPKSYYFVKQNILEF